jgi:hypothetical protein
MANANYEIGYSEGYDSVWGQCNPASPRGFASMDEWDIYCDGYYSGRWDAQLAEDKVNSEPDYRDLGDYKHY